MSFFLILAALLSHNSEASTRAFRIVLDPGHGGTDLGTVYHDGRRVIAEKDMTLLLAQETAKLLRTRGFSVVLTRSDDRELTLPTRTALANHLKADAFVSIHMNSTFSPNSSEAEGIETYILNNTSDASSRRLARLENSVLGPETASELSPEQTDVALILKDLRLDANLSKSKALACSVQENLVAATSPGNLRTRDRGVKQALFYVLLGADMPSILVEAGFLTSPHDRALVLSVRGRRLIGLAITRALERYRAQRFRPVALSTVSRCKLN